MTVTTGQSAAGLQSQVQWLLRLAQDEPQLASAFNQALLKLIDLPQPAASKRRTLGELRAAAKEIE